MTYPPQLSPGAVDFIKCALVRSPEQRTSMQDLLSHAWVRGHMRRAALPHIRARMQTQGDAAMAGGAAGAGLSGGGAGCSGGGGGCSGGGGTGSLGSIAMAGGGAGSLSAPGGGGWGGAPRVQSSGGGASKAGLALASADALGAPGGGCDGGGGAAGGHNSSCPNILHAAQLVSADGRTDCSAPLQHAAAAGLSNLGRSTGSMSAVMGLGAAAGGGAGRVVERGLIAAGRGQQQEEEDADMMEG